MLNESEKLEKFKKAIFDETSAKADEMISAAQKESEEKIAQAKLEAENYIKTQKAQTDKESQAQTVRMISSESLNSKRSILLSREEMIGRVFGNVKAELEKFMKTSDYKVLLDKKINECTLAYPAEKGIVQCSYRDEELVKSLPSAKGYEIKPSENIEVGGVMIVFEKMNLALDCTFDCVLEKQRESFAAKAGLSL
ncbi:V-type ATP synthase subunit E family protein [uncultured Ruminococcus sp.]|uniref:V-type ATP synthase subunit E n=1 Tax=uncultured Ruminococcus sp. TaxID=165186 RepID=UPI0025DF7E81|nr:V-type ATP synthase subunit E family protein [uncultured Ruminococcus sp.]